RHLPSFPTRRSSDLGNAMKWSAIEHCCRDSGFERPAICTPSHLRAADGGWDDPIVAEVRKNRAELSARFNGDMRALGRYATEQRSEEHTSELQSPCN